MSIHLRHSQEILFLIITFQNCGDWQTNGKFSPFYVQILYLTKIDLLAGKLFDQWPENQFYIYIIIFEDIFSFFLMRPWTIGCFWLKICLSCKWFVLEVILWKSVDSVVFVKKTTRLYQKHPSIWLFLPKKKFFSETVRAIAKWTNCWYHL